MRLATESIRLVSGMAAFCPARARVQTPPEAPHCKCGCTTADQSFRGLCHRTSKTRLRQLEARKFIVTIVGPVGPATLAMNSKALRGQGLPPFLGFRKS